MKVLNVKKAYGRCGKCGAQLEISAGDIKCPMSLFDDRAYFICGSCGKKLPVSDEDLNTYFSLVRNN